MLRVIRTRNGWIVYPENTTGDQVDVNETKQAYVATTLDSLAKILKQLSPDN